MAAGPGRQVRCLQAVRCSSLPQIHSVLQQPPRMGSESPVDILWSSGVNSCCPPSSQGCWGGCWTSISPQPSGYPALPAPQTRGAGDTEECEKLRCHGDGCGTARGGRGLGDAGRDAMSPAAALGQRVLPIGLHRRHHSVETLSSPSLGHV